MAPLELRVRNIARAYEVPIEPARKHVCTGEPTCTFVKQSFHTDVADPENYDLVINTAKSDNDAAVGAIIGAVSGGKKLVEKLSEIKDKPYWMVGKLYRQALGREIIRRR